MSDDDAAVFGESLDAFNDLFDRVRSSVAPRDVVEEIWVRDMVDHTWEILRLRKLKAKFTDALWVTEVTQLLEPVFHDPKDWISLSWGLRERRPAAVKKAQKLLSLDKTVRQCSQKRLQKTSTRLNFFDRMIAAAEGRRYAVLREMDRHRDLVARLREVITDIEFEDDTDDSADGGTRRVRSSARVKANRRNAKRSTGPRTAVGKSRVARNALRHGLSAPIDALPELNGKVTRLTRLIVEHKAATNRVDLARRVAEAQIDLQRSRAAKFLVLTEIVSETPPPTPPSTL